MCVYVCKCVFLCFTTKYHLKRNTHICSDLGLQSRGKEKKRKVDNNEKKGEEKRRKIKEGGWKKKKEKEK